MCARAKRCHSSRLTIPHRRRRDPSELTTLDEDHCATHLLSSIGAVSRLLASYLRKAVFRGPMHIYACTSFYVDLGYLWRIRFDFGLDR